MPDKSSTAVRELTIGPFAGGINTYSDPAMIADDEMIDCINFDLSLDGSLVSRPPWSLLHGDTEVSTVVAGTHPDSWQWVIGTGTYETDRFIIVSSNHIEPDGAAYIYYVDGVNAGTLAKIADGEYSAAHRYADDIYLVPDLVNTTGGQKYDLAGGLVTAIPDMESGYSSVIYKDRLWISGRRSVPNSSRLFFSDLADFETWPGTNFFDINPGDGDAVQQLAVYQDNIVIFKDNATYVLAYDTGPAQAVLQVINNYIGASGRNCIGTYENSIFVMKYNQIYEMSNYDFVRVSVKIPFEFDDDVDITGYPASRTYHFPNWISVVGDRLVCRFYNRLYVYHLRLRAWTRWESQDSSVNYIGPIVRLDNTNTDILRGFQTYVAGSTLYITPDNAGLGSSGAWNMYFKLFKMEDRYELTNTENGQITPPFPAVDIQLSMTTKQFDIGLSHRFKRLMHWGLNCYTGRDVTGTLFPFSVAYKVTWNQLHLHFWHDLNTWDYPLTEIPSITQEVSSASGVFVKFIRFPKSLRFRLLQFKITMATQGNTTDGPAYLYNVTAFVGAKQIVPKAVN